MIQLPPDQVEFEPGHAHTWRLSFPDAPAAPASRRPISYNQAVHLGAAWSAHTANRPATFAIACGFQMPGRIDVPALEAAFLHLAHRHEVLRTRCRPTPWGVSAHAHAPQETHLEHIEAGPLTSPSSTRAHLHQLLRQVNPITGPLVVMGAVVRENSATVHVVYDHLVADVLSAPITVAELTRAYEDLAHNRRPDPTPADTFWHFARKERTFNRALRAEDDQLRGWRDFTAPGAQFLPSFPLDLGVQPHHRYPSLNRTHTLLPDHLTQRVETACRASGGTLLTGLLAATATSVRDEGGPDTYRALMPLNRREPDRYSHSVGWFVNAVPIEIPAPRQAPFNTLIAQALQGYEAGRRHVAVASARAQELLGYAEDTATDHHPVNFFSYLDFRTAPGAEHPSTRTARVHLWYPASNGTFFWFHRNHSGLHLNTLHADTPRARHTVNALVHRLIRTLRAYAGASR
ncbi:condensation domain-containing protein [Streptomyces cavernicola]|uniref:Condensation domain-containing protein n=1 Tax=Streptomyces cavernicola TaxID=3043613 RepID=A0ABT6SL38_9ACTN|nr:condensation domain-containing protein [Streptomyces sp. B-S-A6]MDI3408903.1 condensation domain-containing protein [Streptomyces sp. B-S-A6]